MLCGVVWAIPGRGCPGLSGREPRPAHISHSHMHQEDLPRLEASWESFDIVTGPNVAALQLLQVKGKPAPAEGPTHPHSQRCPGLGGVE